MSLIPDFFKNATVAFGWRNPLTGDVLWLATGFFVGVPIAEEPGKYTTFLVTNRHVIDGLPSNDFFMSLNPTDGAPAEEVSIFVKDETTDVALWEFHPNPAVDVAVTSLGLGHPGLERFTRNFFELDHHAINGDQLVANGLTEGSRVSVLGFPMQIVGVSRRSVVVRTGAIAQLDDFLGGRSPSYLIDCATFPGNSGGPVINLLEATSLAGSPAQTSVNLIGITAQSLLYLDQAISMQTGQVRLVSENNSGLSVVFSVDAIRETIEALVARFTP